jgi:hypothetical protein
MVEIGLALAAASKAVAAIQKGFQLHKEATELTHSFSQFFDAKDDIAKARAEADNSTIGSKVFKKQSVESYALDVALAEHKTKELEKQLRELFVYSGQSDVYKTMMRVRSQERQKRLSQARKAAENKRLLFDGLCISFVFFIFGAVIISIFMSINGAVK